MIPLTLPAEAEGEAPFVTRLRFAQRGAGPDDSTLFPDEGGGAFVGRNGLIVVESSAGEALDGDVVLVQPRAKRFERLLRAGSKHNTLLVTERCDQLCAMCSQPPKKTHVDRFDLFEQACTLAEPGAHIGISGGEPTLYKARLFLLLERVLAIRPDLSFHVLTNGQHFEKEDIARLRSRRYQRVSWGIPLYATKPDLHDEIVGKAGAFARLEQSFAHLLLAGARVELRTVVVQSNLAELPHLARFITARVPFVEVWSIMQLEHIGYAKARWDQLFVDHRNGFEPIASALGHAALHGVAAQLFNFPRCTVPPNYRRFAVASISDWKRKYTPACGGCAERESCTGFFEWHPDEQANLMVAPL